MNNVKYLIFVKQQLSDTFSPLSVCANVKVMGAVMVFPNAPCFKVSIFFWQKYLKTIKR